MNSEDIRYWRALKQIKIGNEWRSSVYTECKLSYYQQRPLDQGKQVNNQSFVFYWNSEVVAAFFGAAIESNNKRNLLFYEAPCILIEEKLKLTIRAKKDFLVKFDKIANNINGSIWYRDYLIDGNMSFLTNHLLKKGASATPVFFKVIDLYLDKAILWKHVRKSYSSLINNGLRDMKPYIVTKEEVNWEHMLSFRDLHIHVSGRETRSVESWSRQFESIQNGEAFIVFGELNGDLVTAGYFSYSDINCIYGSSASRRDLFHKPLFHAIMWSAILHAKKIGCRWFEVGEQYFKNHPESNIPTKKELSISDFKSGFGGDIKTCLDVKLNY